MNKKNLFLTGLFCSVVFTKIAGQNLSVSVASTIDFANVSPTELTKLTDVKNSPGYLLGLYYEIPVKNNMAIETGINFGYGRLNHVTIMRTSEFDLPWETLINEPRHLIKGIIPIYIVIKKEINKQYSARLKAGFFYQANYMTEPSLSLGVGTYPTDIEAYTFETKDALKHSVGNAFSVGVGHEYNNSFELQFNLIFGYTFNKPVSGKIAFMPDSEQERAGTIYKTGKYLGLELRYCFKKNKK